LVVSFLVQKSTLSPLQSSAPPRRNNLYRHWHQLKQQLPYYSLMIQDFLTVVTVAPNWIRTIITALFLHKNALVLELVHYSELKADSPLQL
jgi:hypothetical protein